MSETTKANKISNSSFSPSSMGIMQVQNYPTILLRPLTSKMEELLMDIHEREILKLEPYEAAGTKFSKGLLDRGLLEIRDYVTGNGKKIFALYVTNLGRGYLNKL